MEGRLGVSLGLLGNREILRVFDMEYFENSPGEMFLSKMYIQLVCHLFISVLRTYHSTHPVVKKFGLIPVLNIIRPYSGLTIRPYSSLIFGLIPV